MRCQNLWRRENHKKELSLSQQSSPWILIIYSFTMDCTCLVSAVLFVVSNLLGFSYFHRFYQHFHGSSSRHHHDFYANFTQLDPEFIQHSWDYRNEHYYTELIAGILNAIAWMMFCIPLLQVAWMQSKAGTRHLALHVTVAVLALGGSITELIARLMFIGATSTGNWLAKDFNLNYWIDDETTTQGGDMIGWRTLEMIHMITRGLLLWIDAAEWLFLSAIFTLLYLSVVQQEAPIFKRNWARLGLLIAALAFVDFASEVLRLKSWMTFSTVAIFISWISRMLLMPTWLLWLGRQLSAVKRMEPSSSIGNNSKTTTTSGVQEMTSYGSNQDDGGEGAPVYS